MAAAIDGFPFALQESGETPQCLAHIHRNILSFSGGSFQSAPRDASCGQTDCGQRPKRIGLERIGSDP